MNFTEADSAGGLSVQAYAPGRIRIAGRDYPGPLIVTPGRVLDDWAPPAPERLRPADLDPLLALEPEVLLLGTGARQCLPPAATLAAARSRGIGLEVMDTGAACRTYNILLSEGRRVVAGLLPL
jgi:uncharacterized protein